MAINMSIGALKTKITNGGGLQRKNRFLVKIDSTTFTDLGGNDVDTGDGGRNGYYAEDVLLPNISLITQADGLGGPGPGRTSPRGLSYKGGVLITFPIFGNLVLVNSMNAWMKKLYYQNTAAGPSVWVTEYYHQILQNNNKITVDLLDINGNEKGTYLFSEAFPVEISPIEFSSISTNTYATMMVRFAFREYTFSLSK